MDTAGTMELEPDYQRLKASWNLGHRDREDALHLLFLAWMHWADPPFVTGMDDDPDAEELWLTIFDYFDGETSTDAEFLHIAGLMAGMFSWVLGDEAEWVSRAERMKARSLDLEPEGFSPEYFEGRSKYGDYFAHHARASAGP